MFDVIILMAGQGERTNLNYNKVFYPLDNIPIYQYSLKAFLSIPTCQNIILVVHPDEIDLVSKHQDDRILVTTGGETRQDSVSKGMELVTSEYVLIHDGARPNIKISDIISVYEATKVNKASVLAIPVTNTIKVSDNKYCIKTLDRKSLWAMQTPQGVKTHEFKEALNKAESENYVGTDDVELMEKYQNIPAKIVIGKPSNLKVTTEIDFKIIELLMKEGL